MAEIIDYPGVLQADKNYDLTAFDSNLNGELLPLTRNLDYNFVEVVQADKNYDLTAFDFNLNGELLPLTRNLDYNFVEVVQADKNYDLTAFDFNLNGELLPLTRNLDESGVYAGILEAKSSGDGSGPAEPTPIGQYWG